MARKPLSKRLRFEIFKRDGFRCVYCGATPVQAPLHVDHVVAVADHGTDDAANLVTACDSCNLGKSDVPLEQRALKSHVDSDAEHEQPEQIRAYLALQREIAAAKSAVVDALENYWIDKCDGIPELMVPKLAGLLAQWPLAKLMEAVDIISRRTFRNTYDEIRYFYGILRNWKREGPR